MGSLQLLRNDVSFGGQPAVHKMPAHWLMAHLGKRVLRPGGIETTRWLIEHARIDTTDDVVELAPGLGVTARALLSRHPRSYAGIERDRGAALFAKSALARAGFPESRILQGDASSVPLPDACASVVLGEAMLSMQPARQKAAIMGEARRLLRPHGRYAVHELGILSGTTQPRLLEQIQRDLSQSIHVGVRIGTPSEWRGWLEREGFEVEAVRTAPMRLLELDRVIRDEGVLGTARFIFNVLRTPDAAARLRSVRATFRRYERELCAVALIARRLP